MENYNELSIYKKMVMARVELQKLALKKTGYNKFSKYYYFQLNDFLPAVNELFEKYSLMSVFKIKPACKQVIDGVIEEYPEIAELKIINLDNLNEEINFSSPTATAGVKGATDIQELGAKHTYMRRYLWLECMEIVEDDGVDALSDEDKESKTVADKKVTKKQVDMIFDLIGDDKERLTKMLDYYQVNKVEDLTIQQGSEAIGTLKGGNN